MLKSTVLLTTLLTATLAAGAAAQEAGDVLAQPRMGVAYQTTDILAKIANGAGLGGGTKMGELTLGGSASLIRKSRFQVEVGGAAISRFAIAGKEARLLSTDYLLYAPLTMKLSASTTARIAFRHISAHLGDDAARGGVMIEPFNENTVSASLHHKLAGGDIYGGAYGLAGTLTKKPDDVTLRAGADWGADHPTGMLAGAYIEKLDAGSFKSTYTGFRMHVFGQSASVIVRKSSGPSRYGIARNVAEKVTSIEMFVKRLPMPFAQGPRKIQPRSTE